MMGCNIIFNVLLGNMWAQNWEALLDLLVPGLQATNLTAVLHARNYSTFDMVHHAEDFYMSLGLEPMTHSFWKHSQIERPVGSNGTCHGTAANMYQPGDYRYSSAKFHCYSIKSKCFTQVASSSALYLGGPGFKSWSEDQLSSTPTGKCWDRTSNWS